MTPRRPPHRLPFGRTRRPKREATGASGARASLGKRRARFLRIAAATLLLPPLLLILLAALTPLPPLLRDQHRYDSSIRILDRHGKTLMEVRADDGARARWVPLDQISPELQRAMVAAEDQRFPHHPGIDPLAIGRAAFQNLWNRRVVSGASTLTQQLGRNVSPRPRTLRGKVREMALALRIEASLSKEQILEHYLNLVSFGPSLRGVEAGSRFWFDKPANALSLAEAAMLAAIPRGPSMYNPIKAPDAVRERRDRILDRMLAAGTASQQEVDRAKREPLSIHGKATGWGAPHFARSLLSGAVHPEVGPLSERASVIRTTLSASLQREVQTAARTQLSSLQGRNATAAAAVVIDNASGDVLAWLGAPDFLDEKHGGQNDGVLALRQPGSTLKPFVYAEAMEELGWTAATLLPDVELHVTTEQGEYSPRNYDGVFHGPVRLREALANSYNVPAVHATSILGPGRVLERLRRAGFSTLDRDASHYGTALALGDGEVRLLQLANAYASIARGGVVTPVRSVIEASDRAGRPIPFPAPTSERVMQSGTAAVLIDILRDPHARMSAFGAHSVLDLPFDVAVKTGTSKGFRDNLTVGFTREVTVAVWVGNFDGSPMQDVSGITGAGPLFRSVMLAAMEAREAGAFGFEGIDVEPAPICPLSGLRAGPHCPHRASETFLRGTAPERACDVHVEVSVDRRNGLRAGDGCARHQTNKRVFESWAPPFARWAVTAHRPTVPGWSPLCPGADDVAGRLALKYPHSGTVFVSDPSLPEASEGIVLRADAPLSVRRLRFVVDGKTLAERERPFELTIRLAPGEHRARVEAEGLPPSESVDFTVR